MKADIGLDLSCVSHFKRDSLAIHQIIYWCVESRQIDYGITQIYNCHKFYVVSLTLSSLDLAGEGCIVCDICVFSWLKYIKIKLNVFHLV